MQLQSFQFEEVEAAFYLFHIFLLIQDAIELQWPKHFVLVQIFRESI